MGMMWLYDNYSRGKATKSVRWMLMVAWSILIIILGSFLVVAGTYGSVVSIIDSYNESGGSPAWACADNSS